MAKKKKQRFLVATSIDMNEINRAGFEKNILENREKSKKAREEKAKLKKPDKDE